MNKPQRAILLLLTCLSILTTDIQASPADVSIPATDEGLPGAGPIRRYGWFKKLWLRKRTGWARQVQQDQGALVFLGDSITQAWESVGRRVWMKHYHKRNTVNLGISGDRTEHVLWRLDNGNIKGIKPKAAVIMIGTNNTGRNPDTP